MPTLNTSNGLTIPLPGLAKNRPFRSLSQKRVTKCAREALHDNYQERLDFVACNAVLEDSLWIGQFGVNGQRFTYTISAQ